MVVGQMRSSEFFSPQQTFGLEYYYIVSVQPHHPHSNKIYGNTAFSGSNSSIRLLGQVGNFSKVPFSQT